MVINNSQIEILKLLLEDPAKDYNMREISVKTKINYRLIHDGIKGLEKEGIVLVEKKGQANSCKINPVENVLLCCYIENLRKEDFQRQHHQIKIVEQELRKINHAYFTCVLFGDCVKGENKGAGIDLLFIAPNQIHLQFFEVEIKSVLGTLHYKFNINIISEESFLEMKNEKELNVVNRAIKNHILLVGAEQYYRMLIK